MAQKNKEVHHGGSTNPNSHDMFGSEMLQVSLQSGETRFNSHNAR